MNTMIDDTRYLQVLVPSRGRPETVGELQDAFIQAETDAATLTFVVDADDPAVEAYGEEVDLLTEGWLSLLVVPGGTMVKALNEAAAHVLARPSPPYAVAFMGDDHRPRTPGWDRRYLRELRQVADHPGPGRGVAMAYGDDLSHGPNIPTQIAMTTETVRRLGWMAPAGFKHLCIDLVWKDLGIAADRIAYLPDVTVEHLHPIRTGVWTPGHIRVNSGEINAADHAEYERWKTGNGPDDFAAAAARLKGWDR